MKVRDLPKSLTVFALLASAATARAADTPPWTPDDQVLPQLADASDEKFFTIRPPAGYQRTDQSGPVGARFLAWWGGERADHTCGSLKILIVPVPAGEDKFSLSTQLDKFLKGVQAQRLTWSQSDIQTGNVNGTPFARAYWQGMDKQSGLKLAGFYYLAKSASNLIAISSQDLKDNQATDLHLAETSTLTFQMK